MRAAGGGSRVFSPRGPATGGRGERFSIAFSSVGRPAYARSIAPSPTASALALPLPLSALPTPPTPPSHTLRIFLLFSLLALIPLPLQIPRHPLKLPPTPRAHPKRRRRSRYAPRRRSREHAALWIIVVVLCGFGRGDRQGGDGRTRFGGEELRVGVGGVGVGGDGLEDARRTGEVVGHRCVL